MSALATALFDTHLQTIVNEAVVLAEQQTLSDAFTQREFVADEIKQRLQKEYPNKGVSLSVALTWKGVHSVYEVTAIVGDYGDACYRSTVYAELNAQKELVVNKSESKLESHTKEIIRRVFGDLTGNASLTTHQIVIQSEDLIKKALVEQCDGLEEDYEVNVTAGIGKDLSFTVVIEDVRVGQTVTGTLTFVRYETEVTQPEFHWKADVNMDAEGNFSIDPTPISKAQRGRSEKTLVLTMAANRAFTDAFLAHEQDRTAEEFAGNIKLAVIKQLAEEFPADDYSVRTECTEDMVATVWVEAPGVTKIRLRGHRAQTETPQTV